MTERFEVGEVAIITGGYFHPESVGKECQIIGSRFLHHFSNGVVAFAYTIDIDGEYRNANEAHLRKKKPPTREIDQVTTWDKVLWCPREVEHA